MTTTKLAVHLHQQLTLKKRVLLIPVKLIRTEHLQTRYRGECLQAAQLSLWPLLLYIGDLLLVLLAQKWEVQAFTDHRSQNCNL